MHENILCDYVELICRDVAKQAHLAAIAKNKLKGQMAFWCLGWREYDKFIGLLILILFQLF